MKIASPHNYNVFNTRDKWFPWENVTAVALFKTTGDWCLTLGGGKKFDEVIRLYTVPQCDGRTDGRTELVKQYRAMHASA